MNSSRNGGGGMYVVGRGDGGMGGRGRAKGGKGEKRGRGGGFFWKGERMGEIDVGPSWEEWGGKGGGGWRENLLTLCGAGLG